MSDISLLLGKTLTTIEMKRDEIRFTDEAGIRYVMAHNQDCCESVEIEDVEGDFGTLLGSPILVAEKVESREEHPELKQPEFKDDSFTWTFFKLATVQGHVDIRWFGTSNGYYSENVDFYPETN